MDILDIEKKYDAQQQIKIRKQVHIVISLLLILVIIGFKYLLEDASVIAKLFKMSGYTYGPLLGLYAFGLFTKIRVNDKLVPIIAIASPILSYIIEANSSSLFGFEFGFLILLLNGLLSFIGLCLIQKTTPRKN